MDSVGRSPAEAEAHEDRIVLGLLLAVYPAVLSLDELAREVGNLLASDAVSRLERSGLIHRLDGFVFASRSAVRASELGYGP